MKTASVLFFALSTTLVGLSPAQDQPMQPHDPLAEYLFPPEFLMQHQKAIGLTEGQKTFVKSEMQKAQARFMDFQWKLQDEMESMTSLLKEGKSDEQQVLTQLDKVLALERDIKRAQIGLIVRIKNQLTPDQQAALRTIKENGGKE